jgi:cobalt-zinc-cadmium efflux system outer membrane protein
MSVRTILACLGLTGLFLAAQPGCEYGSQCCVNNQVSSLASCPLDTTPATPPSGPIGPAPENPPLAPQPPQPPTSPVPPDPVSRGISRPPASSGVHPVSYSAADAEGAVPDAAAELPGKRTPGKPKPLEIPKDIPGSEAPPIRLPPVEANVPAAQRQAEIKQLFADVAGIEPEVGPKLEPGQSPLTLNELQCRAMSNNPLIRQAASDVEAARGAMIQAGAYPNPHIGYQADTIGTGATAGYQGGNISQTIVTGGKLRLARAAAAEDVENAQLALRRARFDLATQVRTNYFAVLVALERVKVNYALLQFADRVYRTQVTRVAAGQAAAYEPLQLRVLAAQARTQVIQSNHEYEAAWRRLATTLNCPEMPPTPLAGEIDGPVPQITYAAARDRILSVHTDLATAQNGVVKARYQLRLARVTPVSPNIDTSTVIEHDYTVPPYNTTVSLQIGVPVPIFDTNRGNIISAEAALVRASSEYERARNELLSSLADTFARYQTNNATFDAYRDGILADQVRAYRGVYQRYQVDPDADFNDVVTSQQTLAQTISTYIQLVGDRWQATVDLAGLLQADDLFAMGGTLEPAAPTQ